MQTDRPMVMQVRVIFALMMREMTTRYGNNPGGYVWALLEPLGMVAMLAFVFSFLARRPALGESFPVFFASGFLIFHLYRTLSSAISGSIRSNRALLSFPRVTLLDTIIARSLLEAATSILVMALILTGLIVAYAEPVLLDVERIALAVGLALLLGFGVGLLNAVLFNYFEVWRTVFKIINRPLFIISGVFFLYEDMPRLAQQILWWNPLIHITALMRTGLYPTYEPTWASPLYVVYFACVPLTLGIMLLRVLRAEMLES